MAREVQGRERISVCPSGEDQRGVLRVVAEGNTKILGPMKGVAGKRGALDGERGARAREDFGVSLWRRLAWCFTRCRGRQHGNPQNIVVGARLLSQRRRFAWCFARCSRATAISTTHLCALVCATYNKCQVLSQHSYCRWQSVGVDSHCVPFVGGKAWG